MPIIRNLLSELLGGSGDSWNWSEHLHQASFRGVPFAVVYGEGVFGRNVAVHDYPYRDTAWVEDMGRSTRRIVIQGFLVQSSHLYSASDVMTQRDSLIAACESPGAGTLVHPTLGELTVSVPEGGLRIGEGAEQGRVFSFTLTVIESGLKIFAITGTSAATSTVKTSWLSLATKTGVTFISEVKSDLLAVTQAIKTIKATTAFWVRMVDSTADEATNLSNTLKSTFGSTRYGRYNTGTVGGNASGATHTVVVDDRDTNYDTLVATGIAKSVKGHAAISTTGSALLATANIADYPDNLLAVIQAIIAAVPGRGDLIRLLGTLSYFSDDTYYSRSSDNAIATLTVVYINIICAGAMAYAASLYEPQSYEDATNILLRTVAVLDNASLSAANAGFDDAYSQLQILRNDLFTVLKEKGANLASMTTVNYAHSLPALMLANRIYQDANRTESLIKMADPIHPAFMPTTFKALTP